MTVKFSAALVAACLMPAVAPAQEQIPPVSTDKVVVIVSPSGPGSSIDGMARAYMEIAARYTSQKFVIDNRTGAAGFIATQYVLRQPADGLTVQAFTRATTVNFLNQPGAENPLDKYYYVGVNMFSPVILYTYRGGPYADAKQLIAEGRAKASQVWGGASVGGTEWLVVNIIWQQLGIKGKYAAFKDGGALRLAVLGKHLAIGSGDMSDLAGHTDVLAPLMVGAEKRLAELPSVPTLRELGYNVVEGNYRGIVARKDIPQQAKSFHDRLFEKVTADPHWSEYLARNSAERLDARGAQMEKLAKEGSQQAVHFMKEAGLTR
jgi:tripartite-type tricarboxylate transporter receptor subunit TctC